MTTLSLKLPRPLAARLEDRARAHQKPKSALVREFIEKGLQAGSGDSASFHELARAKCGMACSGIRDLATNPKHLEDFGR